jgi:hypothetical protein
LEGSYEAVAATGQSLYKARLLSGIVQRFAQTFDHAVQAMLEIDVGIGRPQPLGQLVTGNQLAGSFQKHGQNLERLFLQIKLAAIDRKFPRPQVEFELSKADVLRGPCRISHALRPESFQIFFY